MYTRRYDDSRGTIDPPENYSGYVFGRSAKGAPDSNDAAPEASIGGCAEPDARSAHMSARGRIDNLQSDRINPINDSQTEDTAHHYEQNRPNADATCPYEQNHPREDTACPYDQNRPREDATCPYDQNHPHEDTACPYDQNHPREDTACPYDQNQPHEDAAAEHCDGNDSGSSGLISGLLNRFRHLDFDDLLLLGLIILLWNGRDDNEHENNDDLLLILGLLFITGL